jgi:DNA-directed RNA polymerase subunit K/omega
MDLDSYVDEEIVEDVPDEVDVVDDNTDEVKILTDKNLLITYTDVNNLIATTNKRRIPILNKYEKARICGVRLQQLAEGAKPCIDTKGFKSLIEIVYEEYRLRKIPFIIERTLPNGSKEYWKMEEFDFLS